MDSGLDRREREPGNRGTAPDVATDAASVDSVQGCALCVSTKEKRARFITKTKLSL